MPDILFPEFNTLSKTREKKNNENEVNTNLSLQSISVPHIVREILQNNPYSKLLVYTRRRYHHNSEDQPTVTIQV